MAPLAANEEHDATDFLVGTHSLRSPLHFHSEQADEERQALHITVLKPFFRFNFGFRWP